MGHLIVDGMNVVGSRPTGWWRDRAGAMVRLADDLVRLAATTTDTICVVFDGRLPPSLAGDGAAGIEVLGAPGGPNAADDRIVALVDAAEDPGAITVVTSDRTLRERVRRRGAAVLGPSVLLERIEAASAADA